MQSDDPPAVLDADTLVTNGFQLQLGPDGQCRIVLLGEGLTALARLDLDAAQADRLAQQLADRRETYEKGKRGQNAERRH